MINLIDYSGGWRLMYEIPIVVFIVSGSLLLFIWAVICVCFGYKMLWDFIKETFFSRGD